VVEKRNKQYLLNSSPFFDKKELGYKTKLIPLEYNEKEDYYITKKIIIKSEEFIKQVVERKTNITAYYNLSNLAKSLLYYITQDRLEYNNLTFHLDLKVFAVLINYKKHKALYATINELIEHKYIARTDTDKLYWINHTKFYKGNYLIIKTIESK
jgi:hypothetical protein